MQSPILVEKAFFEEFVKKKKKISLNLDEDTVNKIDELSKIIGITRTGLMELLCRLGLIEQTKKSEEIYKQMLKMKRFKDKQSIIKKKLNEISIFKKKLINDYNLKEKDL